ncbi:MAG: hypothetical protein IPK71_24345 [Myxococcales bacterium]|jgi:hypothetical protein|nr:hypothetical protein [Myxococcales bacterium]
MVRIHVRPMARGLAVATASLGALAQVGCAAEVDGIDLGDSEDALTSAAGTGVVRLQGFSFGYESTSRGDELVRTGERLQAELSFDELVYVFDYADREGLTPSNVKVTAKVEWLEASGAVRSRASFPVSWGTTGTARVGSTRSFTVPKKAAAFSIDFQVTSGGKTFLVGDRIQVPRTFPIFGYDLPNKVALFDNGPAGEPRTRIVEGGGLVMGKSVTVSMVDWRADAIVDRSRLDARYGRRQSAGRFGPVVVDAIAPIEYEVDAVYTVDGITWSSLRLAATPNARVLQTQRDPRRVAYEGAIALLPSSPELRIAFHVRAFLVVPSFGSEVFDARYAPGSRVLLADRWDNAGGPDHRLPTSRR